MSQTSNIFNIPANYHFFESLFAWLEKKFDQEISNVKIFLPNRRACRELHELFLNKKKNFILPKIKAISDISYEDFFDFNDQELINELLQIKQPNPIEYLFLLSLEIQKLTTFGENLDSYQSFKIALHLKNLFEEIEKSELNLDVLNEIDDSNLSKHRQLTLEFLKNFYVQFKNSLLKKNILISNQNFIIHKFVESLNQKGSKNPIIIAGSTGSISSSKKLIKAISSQSNGYVILHGYKNEKFDQENHPQFLLHKLLEFLEKSDVINLTAENLCLSNSERQKFLKTMTIPSQEISSWKAVSNFLDHKTISADLENNFCLIEAKSEIEEAKIIALILAENKNKKSAIISNNDKLLELLKLELQNSNLAFNDSRNLGIFNSKLVNFLLLILNLQNEFSSANLLALLKHPLCVFSKDKKLISEFEIKILRKPRQDQAFKGIEAKIKSLKDEQLSTFFKNFSEAYFSAPHPKFAKIYLTEFTKNLIKIAESLTDQSWFELLQQENAQVELFEFFEKLKSQKEIEIDVKNLVNFFKLLLSQISFFEKGNPNAAIQILSNIEARLLNYDLVIVASLNDGEFPEIEAENWLGKKIKKDLGINHSLKKIGQNCYNFCNYLSNQKVVLSRSKSKNGAPIIASVFWLKFITLCKELKINLNYGENFFSKLEKINSSNPINIELYNPKPELKFRPQKFSITEISKLISDPYAIYAKKILQLKELEEIDVESSYAEFGSFVHKALEEYVRNPNFNQFEKIFENYFLEKEAKLVWWPKFEQIFTDFILKNNDLKNLQNHLEVPVKLNFHQTLISGKIDRITIDQNNFAEIYDYKTGYAPSNKEVLSGLEPQLTIAALALIEGVIDAKLNNLSANQIKSINYWELSSSKASEIRKICKNNEEIQILIAAAKSGLESLFDFFYNQENGYLSTGKSKEYSHLSRNL